MGAKSAQNSAAAAQAQAASPAPEPADEPAAPQAAESPDIEQLKQFAALRDQGILTEEEFSAKKAQILGLLSGRQQEVQAGPVLRDVDHGAALGRESQPRSSGPGRAECRRT